MADHSAIEWTDATWNPITGCSIKSPGCINCFAMRLAGGRLRNHPSRHGLTTPTKAGPVWNGELRFNEKWIDQPREWTKPRNVFVCAHGDLFHEDAPLDWIRRVLSSALRAHQHQYQFLTKRPGRARSILAHWPPMANWIVGVSVEDQVRADERREDLLAIAAQGWRTFVSYEPAIGPVDWSGWDFIAWMISGGENGPRPTHPTWHRATRDWCDVHCIPYLFKQWGSFQPAADHDPRECGREPAALHVSGRQEYRPSEVFKHLSCKEAGWVAMCQVGKKAAGRLLDGREQNAFPSITA